MRSSDAFLPGTRVDYVHRVDDIRKIIAQRGPSTRRRAWRVMSACGSPNGTRHRARNRTATNPSNKLPTTSGSMAARPRVAEWRRARFWRGAQLTTCGLRVALFVGPRAHPPLGHEVLR